MPDQFNLSGDFRGALVNIKSTLTNVQQSVGQMRTGDVETRRELEQLIGQLSAALQQLPPGNEEPAQAVAETARALVETAKAEKPNQTLLQISAEGLKQAAKNLAEVMPAVVPIASQIVLTVLKLTSG